MGRVLKQLMRYNDALLEFNTAYQLEKNPNLALEIASLLSYLNEPRKALNFAQKARLKDLDSYLLLSYIYRQLDQLQESLNVLLRYRSIAEQTSNPNNLPIDYYLTIASIYYLLDSKEDIVSSLEKALEINPDNPEANNFLGYYLADENLELKRAEKLIRTALKVEPDNPAYLDSLAWVFHRQGRKKEAIHNIQKAIRLQAPNSDGIILDHAGDIFLSDGNKKNALKYWKKALEHDTDRKDEIRKKIENFTGSITE